MAEQQATSKPKHTPLSILTAFYDAERIYMSAPESERDFSAMAATIAPTMQLYQSPALPYGGTYVGRDGFQRWSRQMADCFRVVDAQDVEVFESQQQGADRVVVSCWVRFVARKTGREGRQPLVQVVKVDLERGWMVEMRVMCWDVAGVREVLGV